ncbi:MAG: kelch repeat-containing protein [candidate division WOR-3 bacterium]|nr:hypothetical protein [candidate division WOR-3 bacterium]MDW8113606.1 kelch repeat-containing protein [candidate division WOR-3 bacterium]
MIGIKIADNYIMRLIIILICIFFFTTLFSWEFRRPLNFSRSFLSAPSVLGKIYKIGGLEVDNEICNIVEEYDPIRDTWILKRPMLRKKCDMGCVVVENKIYIFGGITEVHQGRWKVVNDLDVYDPINNTWVRKRGLPFSRTGTRGVRVGNYIYIFGGIDSLYHYLDEVLVYDIERDTWLFYCRMPRPLARPGVGYYDSFIHIIGGEFYSPLSFHYRLNLRNQRWETLPPLPFPRSGFLTTFENGKIYIIGGETRYQNRRVYYKRVDVYDCLNNSWYLLDSINIARSYGDAGILSYNSNNFLYVVGGNTSSGITGSLEVHQLSGIKEEKKKNIKEKENYQILGIYNLLGKKVDKEKNKGIYFYLVKDNKSYKIKKRIVIK